MGREAGGSRARPSGPQLGFWTEKGKAKQESETSSPQILACGCLATARGHLPELFSAPSTKQGCMQQEVVMPLASAEVGGSQILVG